MSMRVEPVSFSLKELCRKFGGEVQGDGELRVFAVASLDNADSRSISFVSGARFARQLEHTKAGAVIVSPDYRGVTGIPHIVCANPYAYFARVSALFNPLEASSGKQHPLSTIDASATIGKGVEIGAYAVIGAQAVVADGAVIGAGCFVGDGVVIGAGTRLYPHVSVYQHCRIGSRCILHSGVIIGADGFGIAMDEGQWIKVPQIGKVVIGDDVEIGANTTIDRGALDDTVIEDGVKLDNLIQIGHNVRVGAHTAIAACAGVAGSAHIGKYCRIGGSSGIAGHVTIADSVEILAHALITKSIDKPGSYGGAYPFEDGASWRRNAVQLRHLDQLARRVKYLEGVIAALNKEKS